MGKIDTVLTRLKAESTSAEATAATDSKQTPIARTELTSYPTIPIDQSHVENNRIVGFGGVSPNALSAYRMIRTRLLQSMRTNHWRSIAVSSAGMGEGKSLTSINLALSLSREGNQNVFLIDLDMRRPTIAKYLGVSPMRGVQDFFDGRADATQIFFRIGAPGLVVAVATESRDNSSELLSSERLPQLIDYVFTIDPKAVLLLDMPPLLVADDALAVAPHVNAILLVATEGRTKRTDLAAAIELVQHFGLAGVVLNRSGESVARYY
jgi:capsular exopolysaccharide synthesis family protein